MSEALTPAARAFAEGEPRVGAARALRSEEESTLAALVAQLVEGGKRAHLEALGEAGLPKAIKKAARKAAYKLKSAGVAGEAKGRAAVDLKARVELDQRALASAVGLEGRLLAMFTDLPGVDGFFFELNDGPRFESFEVVGQLSTGRLRSVAHEMIAESNRRTVAPASASLGVRIIDLTEQLVRGHDGRFPGRWQIALQWRQTALSLGADPDETDARRVLAGELEAATPGARRMAGLDDSNEPLPQLFPPERAVEALAHELAGAAESPLDLTEAQFLQRCDGIIDSGIDSYFAEERNREMALAVLDLFADLSLARGDRAESVQFLVLGDALRSGDQLPHEVRCFAQLFRLAFDLDLLYEDYVAKHYGAVGAAGPAGDDDDEPGSGGLILP